MKRVTVLDCTLRDGGYCNNCKFGKENICKIVNGLITANIDYIEYGFLSKEQNYDSDMTKYTHMAQVAEIMPERNIDKLGLVMINYGEYEIDEIPDRCLTRVDGIRVAFHKKDVDDAIYFCSQIKKKGYLVFVQPMVTTSYTEVEFTHLIQRVNMLQPYAFYIVDSFGMMTAKDLWQYLHLIEMHLQNGIVIGLHAHNNFQMAFSNAIYLTHYPLIRQIIIDVSIYGMGRGAGNLNAELFLKHLNDIAEPRYSIKPILELIDEIIRKFYDEKPWGYSLSSYLSALYMLHPNYAAYLDSKKSLTLKAMEEIFDQIDPQKRLEYDEQYIEELYIAYLSGNASKIVPVSRTDDINQKQKSTTDCTGKNAFL